MGESRGCAYHRFKAVEREIERAPQKGKERETEREIDPHRARERELCLYVWVWVCVREKRWERTKVEKGGEVSSNSLWALRQHEITQA